MFTDNRARAREAEISLEISANVASSKSMTLGLRGTAFVLFAGVLEPLLITINVSMSAAVVN